MNYHEHLERRGYGASPIQLRALASFAEVDQLPPEYVSLLTFSNGSEPIRDGADGNVISFESDHGREEAVIDTIFATDRGAQSVMSTTDDLWRQVRLPRTCLAIASDANGNYIVISVEPDTFGHVYFWDHARGHTDHEHTDALIDFGDQLTKLADTIEEFIRQLSV